MNRHAVDRPGSDSSRRVRGFLRLGLVGWILGWSPPPAPAVELFGPSSARVGVGISPRSIVLGDFNGDGVPDLATADQFSDTLSILLGDQSGEFAWKGLGVGHDPVDLALGDFNGDRAADLAVANSLDDTVTILLGDGQGDFVRVADLVVVDGPRAVVAGEFNGDGAADLAVAKGLSDTVGILLGDGLGGFVTAPDLVAGDLPESLAVGNFNGDGAADLAVVNRRGNSVSIFLGDGQGGFSTASDYGVGRNPWSIVVGDLDGDGAADLATANSADGTVGILRGDGLGGFSRLAADLTVGNGPVSLALGDLNGDGFVDLAAGRVVDDALSILLGDGAGGFARVADIGVPSPRSMVVGELNGDGVLDLAVANSAPDTVSILPGDGLGGFAQGVNFRVGQSPSAMALGEFNGDGAADLAVANFQSDTISILLGDGLGGFLRTADIAAGDGPGCGASFEPGSIAVGEFNGDGAADLAVPNRNDGTLSILLGDGRGHFTRGADMPVGLLHHSVAVGEFNGDGAADLAVSNAGVDTVSILLGDGSGGFSWTADIEAGTSPWFVIAHDLNDDGAADLAVADPVGRTVIILAGDGQGAFARSADIEVAGVPNSITFADLNGDGSEDLVVATGTLGGDFSFPGAIDVLLSDRDGGFVPGASVSVGMVLSVVAGDFNNDGALDVAAPVISSDWVTILLGDGQGGLRRAGRIGVGGAPVAIAAGWFDGDGAVDLAVANDLGDSVSLLFNQLADRFDVNGSNRIDGFDIGAIGRLSGLGSVDPGYQRAIDVDLNGVTDGDDLALVAGRFGRVRKAASPLRPMLSATVLPDSNTITFQQVATEGDLLTVEVLVHDTDAPAAAADIVVTFEPADASPVQVLEAVGFLPGSYLAGAVGQVYDFDRSAPGRVEVRALRFPTVDQIAPGPQPLLSLFLRARREGEARLEFDPSSRLLSVQDCPSPGGCAVPGVGFVGGAQVEVRASGGGSPGRKIGAHPDALDFGAVKIGESARQTLRISNLGFSDLEVLGVSSTVPEFTSFFSSGFTIPPFGFVTLSVEFSPTGEGLSSGELVIESDDPETPQARVRMLGAGGS